jgi:hypothetical protein
MSLPTLLPTDDRLCILRFAATFLWADLDVDLAEHAFFLDLARELGISRRSMPSVIEMLSSPPEPEAIDPTRVSPSLAATVRDVALRAIASDGRVVPREMELFDLLDELLPNDTTRERYAL